MRDAALEISAIVDSAPGHHRVSVRTGAAEHSVEVAPRAVVQARSASEEDIARLLRETDAVAEVHNTLRKGVPVQLLTQ